MKIYFGNEQEEYEREQRREKLKDILWAGGVIVLLGIVVNLIYAILEKIVHIIENGVTTINLSFATVTVETSINIEDLPYLLIDPIGRGITTVLIMLGLFLLYMFIPTLIDSIKEKKSK